MGITIDELTDLQEQVTKADKKLIELKSRQTYLMAEMQKKWKVTSIQAAEKKLAKFKTELEQLETELKDGLKEVDKLRQGVDLTVLEED